MLRCRRSLAWPATIAMAATSNWAKKKEAKWMSIFDLNFTITHNAQFRSSWTGRDAGYKARSSHHLLTAEMDCPTEITERKSRTISCVVSATTTQKYSLCFESLQSKLCACLCCEQVESIVWSWEVSFFHAARSFVEIFSKLLRKRAKSFFLSFSIMLDNWRNYYRSLRMTRKLPKNLFHRQSEKPIFVVIK